jgi:hypothetical protein
VQKNGNGDPSPLSPALWDLAISPDDNSLALLWTSFPFVLPKSEPNPQQGQGVPVSS